MNVQRLIAAQAARCPDRPAVTDGERELSYAQLQARANQLARLLLARGAGPGRCVAVALPPSAELVTAMLGVLKAGAVCVPVDVAAPAAWAGLCSAMAAPTCAITTSAAARAWQWTRPAPLLLDDPAQLAALDALPADAPGEPGRLPLAGDTPAFVQFSSAGAGAPAGVLITYRSLAAAVAAAAALHPHQGIVAASVTQAADPAPAALFAALSAGATVLVCPPGEAAASGLRPAMLRMPADDLRQLALLPADAAPIDELVLYGDVVAGSSLARWRLRHRAVTVTKEYGWAETAGSCAYLRLEPEPAAGDIAVVGEPVPGASIRLIDDDGHRVRRGQVGEACVAGDLVAAGYAGRPDLTARRFPNDPARPGSRLFRTGDLMRHRADGALELVGRRDRHVKIRGIPVVPGDIEAVLLRHPAVARAKAVIDAPSQTIVAHVVPASRSTARHAAAAAESDVVSRWREVYDSLYADAGGTAGADFSGWASSYDGRPIPLDHMREWRDATVRRIRSLRPRRLLEIGVGTGLLLSRLAPACERYWATDLSAAALDRVAAWLARDDGQDSRVVLRHQAADDLTGLPVRFFDTIVLNSVVQYFPGEEYLAQVISGISRLLAPGGAIFIGDVRNLRLERCLRTAVRLTRSPAVGRREFLHEVARDITLDAELLVDPDYFAAWAAADPGRSADIRVKRGSFHNELTRHRYDVVLRPQSGSCPARPVPLDWGACVGTAAELERRLHGRAGVPLYVRGIPNGRLAGELAALQAIEDGQGPDAARRLLGARSRDPDPEQLCVLGERHNYRPVVTWTGSSAEGAVDVLFRPPADPAHIAPYQAGPAGAWRLTNSPGPAGDAAESIASALREFARDQLPPHLAPGSVTVTGRLPGTTADPADPAPLQRRPA